MDITSARAAVGNLIERVKESLPGRVIERYNKGQAGLYAAVVAFNALFAMFPITLAILFVAGLILRDPVVFQQVTASIATALPGPAASEVVMALEGIRLQTGLLGIISFLGFLWAGSVLFGALAQAFNRIYGVPDRSFIKERIVDIAMIFVFAALLLLSIFASTIASLVVQLADSLAVAGFPGFSLVGPIISYLISFAAGLTLFLVIYYFVPNVKLSLRHVWVGALISAILFLLLVQLFPLYVQLIGGFNRYGAVFGFLFLLMTWLYLVAQLLLLGAALNAELHPPREPKTTG